MKDSTMMAALVAATVVCLTGPATHASPAHASPATAWPWGAKVNESVFAPGGAGVTIHAAPTRAEGADGSAAKPYDLDSALKQAEATVRSMEADYQRLSNTATAPLWLRITRRGNEFAAFTAPDDNGRPGAWSAAGDAKSIAMGRDALAGFLVTSNQSFPQKDTFAAATFDNVTVNGQRVGDAAWQSRRMGEARGVNETTAANGQIVVKGNGYDINSKNNQVDSGQYAYVPLAGDGEVVARLSNLTPSEHSKQVAAALVVREALSSGARMMELEVAQKGDNSGLWRGYRADRASPGKSVKVLLAPGVYRSGMWIPERDEVAQNKVFVVEGARQNGQTGGVIISGSEEWAPATWKDEGNGVYSRAWTRNWGGDKLEDRREMIFLTPRGGAMPSGAMQRLTPVLLADWKSAPGTFTVDEANDLIRFRLPAGWDAARLNKALVEVATRDGHLLAFGNFNSRSDDNLVLRNLVFQHSAGSAVQLNWWPEPQSPCRNWILEDITMRHNAGEGYRLNHLRDFTMRRVLSHDNGTQNHMIASEGQILDCTVERNGWRKHVDTFWNALKNVYVGNSSFSENNGNAFRNDHVAENLLIENCRLNNNTGQAFTFETATGPITIRNCEIKNNNSQGGESDDAAVGLATVHNITFDGVTFENNHRSAIAFYPRERAHTANQEGNDELNNNLDVGHWDTDDTPEGRWTPGGKKPANENRNFIIRNCTFLANGANDHFIVQHFYRRNAAYLRNISQELMAYNNRYYNPQNLKPFQLNAALWKPDPKDVFGTLDEWKKQSTQPNFEAGSAWGQNRLPKFISVGTPIARPSKNKNTSPTSNTNGHLIYEVETLSFKASQSIEVLSAPGAPDGKVHRLSADQVGDYGDWVEYTLDVPQAGDYFVAVRYLQDSGPFNYLGYAQLKIDGTPQGDWWDQHGLSRQLMTHHIGPVRLTAGTHTFRFDAVWRNGYGSGDYDITLDSIELSPTLNARPAVQAAQSGLNYQLYLGEWHRLPDFAALKAEDTGKAGNFDISIAEEHEAYALRFTGFITVPRDGIYTFATTVNDGANLYIGDQLVVDNDGVHDGEKNEPWQKRGNIALQKGKHPMRVDFFNNGGKGQALEVLWAAPGEELKPISNSALGGVDAPPAPPMGPNLLNGNTATMEAFARRIKGNQSLQESGSWPQPWSANMWNANATGEITLEREPTTKKKAIALRTLEGEASIQFYTWKNIDLAPGRYEFAFDYMTAGNASLNLNFKGLDKQEVALSSSASGWKRIAVPITVTQAGVSISPQFRHLSAGADKSLYLRNISLRRFAEK